MGSKYETRRGPDDMDIDQFSEKWTADEFMEHWDLQQDEGENQDIPESLDYMNRKWKGTGGKGKGMSWRKGTQKGNSEKGIAKGGGKDKGGKMQRNKVVPPLQQERTPKERMLRIPGREAQDKTSEQFRRLGRGRKARRTSIPR